MPHESTPGEMIDEVANLIAVAALAGALAAAVLMPPFLLFRSLTRFRSHRRGALRQPGGTRP